MSLKGNKPSTGRYIGLSNSQVIAFNPSKEELADLTEGRIELNEEPIYTDVDVYKKGDLYNIASFWLKDTIAVGDNVRTKYSNLRIPMSLRQLNKSTRGTTVTVMNASLNTTTYGYGEGKAYDSPEAVVEAVMNNPKMSWFTKSQADEPLDNPIMIAREGEFEFYRLIQRWLGYQDASDIIRELPFEALMEGEFKSVQDVINIDGNDECLVRTLFYVKNGYQGIYDREFFRGGDLNNRAYEYIMKYFNESYITPEGVTQYSNRPKDAIMTDASGAIPRTLVPFVEKTPTASSIANVAPVNSTDATSNEDAPF